MLFKSLSSAVICAATLLTSQAIFAHDHSHHGHAHHTRADGHAPAGVMFDHMHGKGGLMIGYNAQLMKHGGNWLQGTQKVEAPKSPDYAMYGDNHAMYMHMLHVMYAPTDNITLTLMPMYMSMDMDMRKATDGTFSNKHKTDGWGDTIVGASYHIFDNKTHSLMGTLAFSAPTGKHDKLNARGNPEPYGMQTGAGLWQVLPSLTYQYREDKINAGVQLSARQPLEKTNDLGYYKGSQVGGTAWLSYLLHPKISTSVRVQHNKTDNVRGAYKGTVAKTPAYNADNYGGRQTLAGLGVNTVVFGNIRVGAEYMKPVYEKTNGLQQETDGIWNISISKALK